MSSCSDTPRPGKISFIDTLADVSAAEWNALAGAYPMARHEYLYGLEQTGCAGPDTGWSPQHALLYRGTKLAGAMPLYSKTHSRGEYVFDYAWAHAFERHGLAYYPKLLCAIPFTPVPGPRLLARNAEDKHVLLQAAITLAQTRRLSSLHVLLPDAADAAALQSAGMMMRKDVQFHWTNQGYEDMEDFLGSMNQRNRKKIRQSRRRLMEEDVHFEWRTGADIDDGALDFFYRCYYQTYIEHGQLPYLNPDFFRHLRDTMADSMLIVIARQGVERVAAALNLHDGRRLYGRYWGSLRFVSGLHFETCYMQGIAYSIRHGLEGFEGGAQGEHKLARGLLPVTTYSGHWIREARYAGAIQQFLQHEAKMVERYADELEAHSPYRRNNGTL